MNEDDQTWIGDQKQDNTYDLEGRKISTLYSLWDDGKQGWKEHSLMARQFDDQGFLVTDSSIMLNPDADSWSGIWKKVLNNDAEGKVLHSIYYKWDTDNGGWAFSSRDEHDYDTNGNHILWLSKAWDPELQDWRLSAKNVYSIDSNFNRESRLYYKWNEEVSDWIPEDRDEYTYDAYGYRTSDTRAEWDADQKTWIYRWKDEFESDPQGNVLMRKYAEWDIAGKTWVNRWKLTLDYDTGGKQIASTDYIWDTGTNSWVGSDRSEYYFDEHGNSSYSLILTWNTGLGDWEMSEKVYYTPQYTQLYATTAQICEGDSVLWSGDYYSEEGIYDTIFAAGSANPGIHELQLTVRPRPEAFSITGNTMPNSNGIETYAVPADPMLTYSWYVENGNILSNPDDYSVELQWGGSGSGLLSSVAENEYGCQSDTAILVVTISHTAIEEYHLESIDLYPNPAHGYFYVEMDDFQWMEPGLLQIISPTGIIVSEVQIESATQKVELPARSEHQLYLVRIIGPDGKFITTRKIVME